MAYAKTIQNTGFEQGQEDKTRRVIPSRMSDAMKWARFG